MPDHSTPNRQRRTLLTAAVTALAAPELLVACGGSEAATASGFAPAPAATSEAQPRTATPAPGYTVVAAYYGGWRNPPGSDTPWYPPDIWGAYGAPYAGTFTLDADATTLHVTLTSGSIAQTNPLYPAPGCEVGFSVTGGSLPAPLVAGVGYYALATSPGTVKLFHSYRDAVGGTALPIRLTGGSGVLKIASRNLAFGTHPGWFMGAHPERTPAIGANDESLQWVMDNHIQTASRYGVQVFAMNWYRDDFLTYATENYMASPYKMAMHWFIQWSNNANTSHDPAIPTNSQQYFFEGIRRAATHMSDPAYYRVNGLPVLSIFYPVQIDAIVQAIAGTALAQAQLKVARAGFLASCQQIVANVLAGDHSGGISGSGNNCTVAGSYRHAMHLMICTADVGGWANLEPVDGMYRYNVRGGTFGGVARAPHNYTEQMSAVDQAMTLAIPATGANAPGRAYWPTLMAGWNMQPVGGSPDPLADYPGPSAAEFQTHCQQIKGYLDQWPQTNRTLFVYAWNELGEGGYLLPTATGGTAKLETLNGVFG